MGRNQEKKRAKDDNEEGNKKKQRVEDNHKKWHIKQNENFQN
jgi:hypothetical protein